MNEQRIINNRNRRNRQLRNHVVIFFVTVLAVIFLAVSLGSFFSKASDNEHEEVYKYYTCIIIEKGATLYSIAEEYAGSQSVNLDDYIEEVKNMNHLDSDEIISGQSLLIPYYSSEFVL